MSEPIISPWIFYLINLLSNLDGIVLLCIILCGVAVVILGLFSIFSIVDEDEDETEEDSDFHITIVSWFKRVLILFMIFAVITALIPDKQTMYTMLVSDQLTYENIDKLGDNAKDTVDYIFDKIEEVQNESTDSEGK